MGYYSFYKIIKDFFRTIFGNKILKLTFIFILIFLILLIFNKNKVNASISLELTGGSITIPSWVNGSDTNAYIFQSPIDENGKYNFCTIFARGGGNLKLGTYNGETAFTNTGNGVSVYSRREKLSYFNGSVSEYQTYLNSYFNSNNMYWSTWQTYSSFTSHNIDPERCYINGTKDILNADNSVYVEGNSLYTPDSLIIYPYFENLTEIQDGNPDGVIIDPGDFSKTDNIYFHLLEIQTGISSADDSIYYYLDKTFLLNKDSDYFSTMLADPNVFYYFIPRYKLGLSQNSSYLYVINNSKNQIQNSHGLIEKDTANGIYDVISSDTTGVITATEEESDRMKNIEQSITNNENTINNINNTITDTNVSQETQTDIDTNLNFNNSAPEFSSLFNGFFSRLTSTISDLGNYQDTDVITIYLPIPFTNDTIPIRSDFIFSNQNNNFLRNITILLWYFIFGRYFLYFLINTYWLITTGRFFDNYLTQKEAITGDML